MQQAVDTGGWLRAMLRETDNAASIPSAPVVHCRNPQARLDTYRGAPVHYSSNEPTNGERSGLLREMAGLDEGAPLFVQVAERLAEDIADGTLAEGERVPSTNELAAYYRINPATAAKGINMLTDDGLLEKRRGIGMFVAAGARARLLAERHKQFAERFVEPLVAEASRLGIDADELVALIRQSGYAQEGIKP
jgi:DNA-binding transcriptional regulator YhcF (GntR family)